MWSSAVRSWLQALLSESIPALAGIVLLFSLRLVLITGAKLQTLAEVYNREVSSVVVFFVFVYIIIMYILGI